MVGQVITRTQQSTIVCGRGLEGLSGICRYAIDIRPIANAKKIVRTVFYKRPFLQGGFYDYLFAPFNFSYWVNDFLASSFSPFFS